MPAKSKIESNDKLEKIFYINDMQMIQHTEKNLVVNIYENN